MHGALERSPGVEMRTCRGCRGQVLAVPYLNWHLEFHPAPNPTGPFLLQPDGTVVDLELQPPRRPWLNGQRYDLHRNRCPQVEGVTPLSTLLEDVLAGRGPDQRLEAQRLARITEVDRLADRQEQLDELRRRGWLPPDQLDPEEQDGW